RAVRRCGPRGGRAGYGHARGLGRVRADGRPGMGAVPDEPASHAPLRPGRRSGGRPDGGGPPRLAGEARADPGVIAAGGTGADALQFEPELFTKSEEGRVMAQAAVDPEAARRMGRRAIIAAAVGTSIEWYDFFLYTTVAALVIPKLFFPNQSPTVGLLA